MGGSCKNTTKSSSFYGPPRIICFHFSVFSFLCHAMVTRRISTDLRYFGESLTCLSCNVMVGIKPHSDQMCYIESVYYFTIWCVSMSHKSFHTTIDVLEIMFYIFYYFLQLYNNLQLKLCQTYLFEQSHDLVNNIPVPPATTCRQ